MYFLSVALAAAMIGVPGQRCVGATDVFTDL